MNVTREEIQTAKSINLVSFLLENFPEIITYNSHKSAYVHIEHDSLIINPTAWYQFSTDEGGDTIQFLVKWLDFSFVDAVKKLCTAFAISPELAQLTSFRKPRKSASGEACRPYLLSRGISDETITDLIKKDLIYEGKNKNIVFCSEDFYIIRGTLPGSNYKQIITKYPNSYWTYVPSYPIQKVYICESPIDALSIYEITKNKNAAYIAMGGLKKNTTEKIIEKYPQEIIFGTDWDKAGLCFFKNNFSNYTFLIPKEKSKINAKDWNEVLLYRKNMP